MRRSYIAVLVVGIVLAAGTLGMLTAVATAQTDACTESATHSFRTTDAVAAWNETGSATTTVANTEVTVSDDTGFVRLAAENPNAYCVDVTVEIPSDIVQPTDLGTVASVNESSSVTADWRSYQNFTSGERYTTVEFTLPAASSVEFALSKARVVTLSWATSAQDSAEGIFSTVTGLFGDDEDLSQRTYDIDGRQGNRKTVPLTSANTSQRVEEWFAEYQTSEGDWAPVGQDPEAPVYYTQPNRDEVRLHYNTNTTVRFTANPTLTESVSYRWTSYTAGWDGLGSLVDNLSF
jgi:hypothetical protein